MAERPPVLVVDDDPELRAFLIRALAVEGYPAEEAAGGAAAAERLSGQEFAVVVADVFLKGLNGIELLKRVRASYPSTEVVLMGREVPTYTVVAAMRQGAADFMEKPVDVDYLLLVVQRAVERVRLAHENLALRRVVGLKTEGDGMVAESPAMAHVIRNVELVAPTDLTVLIEGESGVGKELVAGRLHRLSQRHGKPFVAVNCGAIQESLLESELFGHRKGAFTGATQEHKGLFEVADGGTLFLDEIGDMDLDMQTKLLRVLQDGVLRRVGSKEFRRVDVRIVSATNKDLLALIGEARFREDLYYRLNVINITLPPLRDRPEDIPLLTQHFLARQAADAGHDPCELSPAALDLLLQHPWPGNIRELENELLRASALGGGGGAIEVHHLSRAVTEGGARQGAEPATARRVRGALLEGKTLKELVAAEVEEVERHAIAAILRRTEYTKTKAASILGISRPTLDAKIDKYGLTRDQILGS